MKITPGSFVDYIFKAMKRNGIKSFRIEMGETATSCTMKLDSEVGKHWFEPRDKKGK